MRRRINAAEDGRRSLRSDARNSVDFRFLEGETREWRGGGGGGGSLILIRSAFNTANRAETLLQCYLAEWGREGEVSLPEFVDLFRT